jgi:hypothetical protein
MMADMDAVRDKREREFVNVNVWMDDAMKWQESKWIHAK